MRSAQTFTALAASIVACLAVAAADSPLAFDLADVHPADAGSPWALSAMRDPTLSARVGLIRGGRYEIHSATLVDLISTAWKIDPLKVIDGPPWLDTARFDIVAKVPAGATAASLPLMLQALLVDRFHLGTRAGTRPYPEMILSAGARPHVEASGRRLGFSL